jgi:hypothetical protein
MYQKIKIKAGRPIILPGPEEDAAITAAALSDPDALPMTGEEWESVKPTLRRGRPGSSRVSQIVSMATKSEV